MILLVNIFKHLRKKLYQSHKNPENQERGNTSQLIHEARIMLTFKVTNCPCLPETERAARMGTFSANTRKAAGKSEKVDRSTDTKTPQGNYEKGKQQAKLIYKR